MPSVRRTPLHHDHVGPVPIEKVSRRTRAAEHIRRGSPLVDLGLALVAAIATTIPLVLLGTDLGYSLLYATVATIGVWALVRFLRSISFFPMFRLIYSLNQHLTSGNRTFFRGMARDAVQKAVSQVIQLVSGLYVPEDLKDLQRSAKYCFDQMNVTNNVYIGVDSNLPSQYMEDYSWFLDLHEGKLDRLSPRDESGERHNVADHRVVIAYMGELTRDFDNNPGAYVSFIEWHKRNRVTLHHIEPDKAKLGTPRHQPTTRTTLDIAYWGSLVGGFKLGDTATGVKFWFLDAEDYKLYAEYVNAVLLDATPFPESPTGLRMVSPGLAAEWPEYIGLDHRARHFGVLLQDILGDLKDHNGIILDAAAGVGAETLTLLKAGFSVTPNEVDGELKKQLEADAQRSKCSVHVLTHPWEHLEERLENQLRFDAVLVVGNSICMVTGSQQERGESLRRRCVRNFKGVLKRNGRLVIDERNFQNMLDNREAILKGPFENFAPARHGDVMYAGDDLRGYPAEIEDGHVLWRFFRKPAEVSDSEDLWASIVKEEHGIDLYPFKCGELYDLLSTNGFRVERVYGDLEPIEWDGQGSYPVKTDRSPYEFFTYVARRT